MKKNLGRTVLVLLLLFLIGNSWAALKASAQQPPENADARVRYFYDSLTPYGNWIWQARYGWCWYPYNVAVDWRPYSDGYWQYSDYGWTWVSDVPWGWACFHYGRWFYDDTYGWLWWPDTVWAPSWVIWRTGGDWIGWAPCPPEALWRDDFGMTFGFGVFEDFFPSRFFCFVRRRHFIDHDLRHSIEMRARNVTIFNETAVNSDNLRSEGGRIVNRLPVQEQLERDLGHPIERFKVANAESPESSRVEGKEIRLFRPAIQGGVREGVSQPARAVSQSRILEPPPEIAARHAAEMRALEESQQARERMLQQQHAQEMSAVPPEVPVEQLRQRQQRESQAQRELMSQERQLIQSWHRREATMATAPSAPPQRRFNFMPQQSGFQGSAFRNEGGSRGGNGGGRYRDGNERR